MSRLHLPRMLAADLRDAILRRLREPDAPPLRMVDLRANEERGRLSWYVHQGVAALERAQRTIDALSADLRMANLVEASARNLARQSLPPVEALLRFAEQEDEGHFPGSVVTDGRAAVEALRRLADPADDDATRTVDGPLVYTRDGLPIYPRHFAAWRERNPEAAVYDALGREVQPYLSTTIPPRYEVLVPARRDPDPEPFR